VIPFGIQWANFGQIQITQPVVREISLWGMGVLALLTATGIFVMTKLKRANPWFMGAMLVSMIVTMMDVRLTALPSEATNIAQLFIGEFWADSNHAASRTRNFSVGNGSAGASHCHRYFCDDETQARQPLVYGCNVGVNDRHHDGCSFNRITQ